MKEGIVGKILVDSRVEEEAFGLSVQIGREFPGSWLDSIVDRVISWKLVEGYPDSDYQWLSDKGYTSTELRHLLGFWSYYEQKHPEWFGDRGKGDPFTFAQVVSVARKVYRARLKI